jgi:hypothetical protein
VSAVSKIPGHCYGQPSYVHSQSQNNRKIHVNFAARVQNMWQEVTSYLDYRFLSKDVSKAVSTSKNESMEKISCNERAL